MPHQSTTEKGGPHFLYFYVFLHFFFQHMLKQMAVSIGSRALCHNATVLFTSSDQSADWWWNGSHGSSGMHGSDPMFLLGFGPQIMKEERRLRRLVEDEQFRKMCQTQYDEVCPPPQPAQFPFPTPTQPHTHTPPPKHPHPHLCPHQGFFSWRGTYHTIA